MGVEVRRAVLAKDPPDRVKQTAGTNKNNKQPQTRNYTKELAMNREATIKGT